MSVVGAIIGLVTTIFSVSYQYTQQQKAKKKAEAQKRAAAAAEDARKGFEVVVEGEIISLPIYYGRNKAGGARVFHRTSSAYGSVQTNGDKFFSGGKLRYTTDKILSGEKHEYLMFQQTIAKGDISRVLDVVIDDSFYIDSPELAGEGGFRIDCHYTGGNPCWLMTANTNTRKDAKFTGVSFITCAFKLDRDDPQFGSIPSVQLFIEGRKVHNVSYGLLSIEKFYSNNPALVLLNYLLEEVGIPVGKIDLNSFEQGRILCDTIVKYAAPCGGNIWKSRDGSSNVSARNLPLYECNIALDSKDYFRDNIAKILGTMGDARLVRSQGKYKLSVKYPDSYATTPIDDIIGDNRLILGSEISETSVSSNERYNHAIVKFFNESKNFETDTARWPPKTGGVATIGYGGKYYTEISTWDDSVTGKFLNEYAVYDASKTFNWQVQLQKSGTYHVKFVADLSGSISFGANTYTSNGSFDSHNIVIGAFAGTAGALVNIVGTITSDDIDRRGFAAVLIDPDGVTVWDSRDISYTSLSTVARSSNVYELLLAEDNNVKLETDITFEGATDYYHALAKAEELVRTSRSANQFEIEYIMEDKYPEPGDILQISCTDIALNGLLLRVDTAAPSIERTCKVTGTRFDYTQLAWNVNDDEYIIPGKTYISKLPKPMWLQYFPGDDSGYLKWALVDDSRISYYELYVRTSSDVDSEGNPLWRVLGRSHTDTFQLPKLYLEEVIFGVRSVDIAGHKSDAQIVSINISYKDPPAPTNYSVIKRQTRPDILLFTWDIPALRSDGSVYRDHYLTKIYVSTSSDFSTAKIMKNIIAVEYEEYSPDESGTFHYWLANMSTSGRTSPAVYLGSISVDFWTQFDINFIPPAPFDFLIDSAVLGNLLSWTIPVYSGGGGHAHTLIFAAEWIDDIEPSLEDAEVIATLGLERGYYHSIGTKKKYKYWLYEQTYAGGVSATFAGPLSAQANGITAVELEADAVNESSLSAELRSKVNAISDDLWSVKLDNNGFLAGFGLSNTSINDVPLSEFTVLADRFALITSNTDVIAITSLTRVDTLATAVCASSHGLSTSDYATITGATEGEWNGTKKITRLSATEFTYAIATSAATSASGPLKVGKSVVPFVIEDSTIYMNGDMLVQGLIQAGELTADRVTSWSVQSSNYVAGSTGFKLDAIGGTAELNDMILTFNYSDITDAPTTLAGLDAAAANKLGGISAGATVGAPSGTYVGSTSASTVEYNANNPASVINSGSTTIAGSKITTGTIYACTLSTAYYGQRVEISSRTNDLKVYDSSGTKLASIGEVGASGFIYCSNTTNLPAIYGQSSSNSNSSSIEGVSWGTQNAIRGISNRSNYAGIEGFNWATYSRGIVGYSSWDFYAAGSGTNYGPFTGGHDCLLVKNTHIPIGYIVEDDVCVNKQSVSNTIFSIKLSNIGSRPIGIVAAIAKPFSECIFTAALTDSYDDDGRPLYITGYNDIAATYNLVTINAVGEGQVMVCGENGNMINGDLICCSTTPGVGMKQSDDIVRNTTVAKIRGSADFVNPTDVQLVPCIYLCG